ncbi:PD40 domain-containing protein [Luteitalea pratensis]|nr:PD40 domain-containing protein [Luteitalea pratensis]
MATLLVAPAASAQPFGEWSPPVSIDPGRQLVNTPGNDGCPIEAPDGLTLFFASTRTDDPQIAPDLNIWVAYRASEDVAWSEIERLPLPVNSGANEFCPTPLPGNRLLFVSTRANECAGVTTNSADIYFTRQHPVRGRLTPQSLCNVNSTREEFSPALVEADGVTMLYFSSNRLDPLLHKIYVSVLDEDGTWGMPSLVDELNQPGAYDARPNVRKDGLEIVFDSNRSGSADIFTSTRSSVTEPWSAPRPVDAVNSGVTESRPSISRDGTRLYFGSARANGLGNVGTDIFVSMRSGPGKEQP